MFTSPDSQDALVEYLIRTGILQTPTIIEAFRAIDRKDFVIASTEAYADIPLPIGYGQTISQPATVAYMLEWLQPKEGDHVLDIGSGSGWTTALLAYIVGERGHVTGLERISGLVTFGSNNLGKYKLPQAENKQATEGILGAPGRLFDKILLSAASEGIPGNLFAQLKTPGDLVGPVHHSIVHLKKTDEGIREEEHPGFSFVPLIL